MIKQFVTNKSNQRIGVLVAISDPREKFKVGWSKCKTTDQAMNYNAIDKFDRERGIGIAVGRAERMNMETFVKEVPASMVEDAARFVDRCERYFK